MSPPSPSEDRSALLLLPVLIDPGIPVTSTYRPAPSSSLSRVHHRWLCSLDECKASASSAAGWSRIRKESREKSTFTPNIHSVHPDTSMNGTALRNMATSGKRTVHRTNRLGSAPITSAAMTPFSRSSSSSVPNAGLSLASSSSPSLLSSYTCVVCDLNGS